MKNERGLTLIELLATITIFSMIVGVTYSLVTYVHGSWTHANGISQTESKVHELQTILTRELSSPTTVEYSNGQILFQNHDHFFYKLQLDGNQLSLYKGEGSYASTSLIHSFTLPVSKVTMLSKNKSVIPSGTTLEEGYAILRFHYVKEGLKEKPSSIDYTVNLYDPSTE